jgi:thioredoxin 1
VSIRTTDIIVRVFEQLTQFDLHHRLAETDGVALVFFSAPTCGACRHLRGVLDNLRQRLPQWQVYEVDAQQDLALVREFEVFHLPALFLFHAGHFHCPLHAEASPAAIEKAVAQALASPAKEAP